MKLGHTEIEELVDEIKESETIIKILTYLNRIDELYKVLKGAGLENLIKAKEEYSFTPYKTGKIVVLGASQVKEEILIAICKKHGIQKERLEFCLDYDKIEKFDTKKLRYNSNYCAILIGPAPHSSAGKENSSSIITNLDNKEGYPPLIKLDSGNQLKITKSSFSNAIMSLLDEEIIVAS